ncbi:MAG: serine--tRNA ligase [Solirubrobacterales bacterium]|nr:serine--tRNA ligase [Solirubrobacterales bacterium]
MLDLKLIRAEPDRVRAALARRGDVAEDAVDVVLALDADRRAATEAAETLRARQKQDARAVAAAQKAGEDTNAAIAAAKALAEEVKARTAEASDVGDRLEAALAALPNLPDPSAAAADEVVREVGDKERLDFEPRDHLALAGDRIDMERGARLSGSRFAYLRGELVFLELALVQWTLSTLAGHGFEPVIPPVLVREQALYGTGFLPDTEQQIYHLPADDLYLAGTSEVALASLHAGEVLDAEALPLRYAGFSPCFRREAGTAGRDTRGIFRVHQFDKVEMFSFVRPEESQAEHERLLAIEEELLTALGIPYRVVNIAVDDLGASAAKKYDCEAWLPGQGQYRELTSTSNTTDFQARRLGVRYRPEGGKPAALHTLNGTAVAVGRTLIALMENGQQADGSVVVPEVLVARGAPALLAPAA